MKSKHTFVVLAYGKSKFLEECIKSVINQSIKTDVVIATTTDNDYIRKLSKKYELKVVVGKHTNIGGDFDFARLAGNTSLVTVAHQDDIYDYKYVENILKYYDEKSLIIFSNYYEIRNNKKVLSNKNLNIKKFLLLPLKFKRISGNTFIKRLVIRFGNSICCPAVTFNNDLCPNEVFTSSFKCNCDWYAWEKLSKKKGKFIYIPQQLMGHRIDETTTTTDLINNGIRTQEDLIMFNKFWCKPIASIINKFYKKSEDSNNY